jgi:hypothetical protein
MGIDPEAEFPLESLGMRPAAGFPIKSLGIDPATGLPVYVMDLSTGQMAVPKKVEGRALTTWSGRAATKKEQPRITRITRMKKPRMTRIRAE